MPRTARTFLPWLVLVIALVAAACGGGGDDTAETADSAAAPPPPAAAATPTAAASEPAEAAPAPAPAPAPVATPTEDPKDDEGPAIELPAGPPTEGLPGGRYAQIDAIALDGDTYVVDFTPFNFTPVVGPGPEDFHVHFFWDTVEPQNAGTNGPAPASWDLYGGGSPYTGMTVNQVPAGATRMCVLVADAGHGVTVGTGNCMPLPA